MCIVAVGNQSIEPTPHPCAFSEQFFGCLCRGVATNNTPVGLNPLVLIWLMTLLSGSHCFAIVQSMWNGFVKIGSHEKKAKPAAGHEKKVKPAAGLMANSRLQGQGHQECSLLGLQCVFPSHLHWGRQNVIWRGLPPFIPLLPHPSTFLWSVIPVCMDTRGRSVILGTAPGFCGPPHLDWAL